MFLVYVDNDKADAMRTEPFFSDNNGHVYWRLKGCSDKPGILLQGEIQKQFIRFCIFVMPPLLINYSSICRYRNCRSYSFGS